MPTFVAITDRDRFDFLAATTRSLNWFLACTYHRGRPFTSMTREEPCPFCDRGSRVGFSSAHSRAFLDAYPVAEGHTLVVPVRHVLSVFDLPAEELADLWRLVGEVRAALAASYKPDGFTIGLNDGAAAGQTIPHAHVHVIPRRPGDVADPRGGVRRVIPDRALYWEREAK